MLWNLIPAASIRHLALAFGALAFWDALFIWGGPLAYSLAACLWVLALAFSLHDAQRGESRPLLVFLLLFLALLSHPFAAIFVLPLAGLRLLLIPKRRAADGVSLLLLAGYSLLILRDSAEPAAAGGLSALFSFFNAQPAARIFSLFTQDADMLRALLDSVPLPVLCLLEFYSLIRLIGYLASPWLLWRHRREPHLVLLLTINTIVFVLFL